jgi:hypothetical protein
VKFEGMTFHSKGEFERYLVLRDQEKCGEIENFERQVVFKLEVNGILVTKYVADFVYRIKATSEVVVEDWKGKRTEGYIIKRKLMLALFGIVIKETGRAPSKRRKSRKILCRSRASSRL